LFKNFLIFFRNAELFYEARDTLRDIFQRPDKINELSYQLDSKSCFSKSRKSIDKKIQSNVDLVTSFNKIFSNSNSNHASKKTDYTNNKEENLQVLQNLQNVHNLSYASSPPLQKFISEKKVNNSKHLKDLTLSPVKSPVKNLSKSKNDSYVNISPQKDCPPISMKFNNNISTQSKINLNFNININCEGNKKNKIQQGQSNQNSSRNLTNSINLNDKDKSKSEKLQESCYETVRNYGNDSKCLDQKSHYESDESNNSVNSQSDSDEEFYYEVPDLKNKIENIEMMQNSPSQHFANNQILMNNEHITKSSVTHRKDTFEDLISDVPYLINKRRMSEIKFEIKYEIDMNFIRTHFKNVPVKV
jgi:hypothetical protein